MKIQPTNLRLILFGQQRSADNMASGQPEGDEENPDEGTFQKEVTTVTTTKTTTYTVERTGDQVGRIKTRLWSFISISVDGATCMM